MVIIKFHSSSVRSIFRKVFRMAQLTEVMKNRLHALNGIRQVSYRYELLNKNDIKVRQNDLPCVNGRITYDSEAVIKRTASFYMANSTSIDWLNHRIRPVMRLQLEGDDYVEWPLGIFIPATAVREINSGDMIKLDCYDASLIIDEDKLDNRYRIPAGTAYTKAIKDILASAGLWKCSIAENIGVIGVDKEYEIGVPKIDVINSLLREMNYTSIYVDEYGYFVSSPYIKPTKREVDYEYRTDGQSIILTGGRLEETDIFNTPNHWVVTCSTPEKAVLVSTYTNSNPTSLTSTISRGRKIVSCRWVDDILDQATLDGYVQRIAYEESSDICNRIRFSTPNMPNHGYMNCLWFEDAQMGISGKYIESSWEMNLGENGGMSHVIKKVVNV